MAISWTLIVLGTLLQGMQCNANDNSTTAPNSSISPTSVVTTAAESTLSLTSLSSTKPTTSSASLESALRATTPATTPATLEPSKSPTPSESSTPSESTTQAPTTSQPATSPDQPGPSSTVANQDINTNTPSQTSQVKTQVTTIQPTTSNEGTTPTTTTSTPPNSPTTLTTTDPKQGTTDLNKHATTFPKGDGTTQLMSTQTATSAVTKNSELPITTAPGSKSTATQSLGTTTPQTTTALIRLDPRGNITTNTPLEIIQYSFNLSKSNENHVLGQTCKMLLQTMKGNCIINVTTHGNQLTATVIIDADQVIPPENYKQVSEAPNNNTHKENLSKDTIPDTLIAILASCGALVLILCCFAAYCTYHRRSYRKNQQQHLTEELQTVENGYHDNPTLEVMEVQPEMQEKKLTMNRDFNDSWIVPIDNLLKEDIPDEEDTHL